VSAIDILRRSTSYVGGPIVRRRNLQEIGGRADDDHAQREGEFNPQIFALVGLNVESESLASTEHERCHIG